MIPLDVLRVIKRTYVLAVLCSVFVFVSDIYEQSLLLPCIWWWIGSLSNAR